MAYETLEENLNVTTPPDPSTGCDSGTGTVRLELFHSSSAAANWLQENGSASASSGTWVAGFQYGNVSVDVSGDTPPDVLRQVGATLSALPGIRVAYGSTSH